MPSLSTIYIHLWSLLESHRPFAALVPPGNRIKLTAGKLLPFKPQKQEADFPEALLLLGDDFHDSLFTLSERYDYYLSSGFDSAADDWPEEIRQTYTLTLTHRDMRLDCCDALECQTLAALRNSGPRLGLPGVYAWGPVTGRRQYGLTSQSAGAQRMQTTFTIPIILRLSGRSLLTP